MVTGEMKQDIEAERKRKMKKDDNSGLARYFRRLPLQTSEDGVEAVDYLKKVAECWGYMIR